MFNSSPIDYSRAAHIVYNWYYNINYKQCNGRELIKYLDTIQFALPNFCITNTSSFGSLLSELTGKELLFLMEVLLAHISTPNFILDDGNTFLQRAIATGNRDLVRLLISNTHGSKVFKITESLWIDPQSAEWIKYNL